MEDDGMLVRHVDLVYTLALKLCVKLICEELTGDAVKSQGFIPRLKARCPNPYSSCLRRPWS